MIPYTSQIGFCYQGEVKVKYGSATEKYMCSTGTVQDQLRFSTGSVQVQHRYSTGIVQVQYNTVQV